MKKTILLSLITASLFAFDFHSVLPAEVKSTDFGGTKPAIDAYRDGIGVRVVGSQGSEHIGNDFEIYKKMVFKYGKQAKDSNISLAEYVSIDGNEKEKQKMQNIIQKARELAGVKPAEKTYGNWVDEYSDILINRPSININYNKSYLKNKTYIIKPYERVLVTTQINLWNNAPLPYFPAWDSYVFIKALVSNNVPGIKKTVRYGYGGNAGTWHTDILYQNNTESDQSVNISLQAYSSTWFYTKPYGKITIQKQEIKYSCPNGKVYDKNGNQVGTGEVVSDKQLYCYKF